MQQPPKYHICSMKKTYLKPRVWCMILFTIYDLWKINDGDGRKKPVIWLLSGVPHVCLRAYFYATKICLQCRPSLYIFLSLTFYIFLIFADIEFKVSLLITLLYTPNKVLPSFCWNLHLTLVHCHKIHLRFPDFFFLIWWMYRYIQFVSEKLISACNLIIWPIIVEMILNFNSICWNNSKFHV